MEMETLGIVIITELMTICYILCCVASYGFTFAYMQKEWPRFAEEVREADIKLSLFISILGPLSLVIACIMTKGFKHGFKWR